MRRRRGFEGPAEGTTVDGMSSLSSRMGERSRGGLLGEGFFDGAGLVDLDGGLDDLEADEAREPA